VFKGIIDHRRKGQDTGGAGMSAKGWESCVEWTDGTTMWLPLKELRDSNPIEAAEYALSRDIINEKSFAWWDPKALRKRDSYLSKLKTRYWKRTHKFGIEMPKSVKDALILDAQAGTTLWRDAIAKEMKNVMPTMSYPQDTPRSIATWYLISRRT
jgi:hypothetical protein